MNDKQFAELMEKVEIVAKLLAFGSVSDKKTLGDRAVELSEAGLRPKDIGWLLGKNAQRINEILYQQRKKLAKSGKTREVPRVE